MTIKVKKVENQEEWAQVLNLRYRVFVKEQGVPEELERDEKDETAVHVIVKKDGNISGCGRVVFRDKEAKLGRIAVDKNNRNRGIGTLVCQKLMKIADNKEYDKITLHAQLETVEFYRKFGFRPVGDIFQEAGIEHIKMEYKNK